MGIFTDGELVQLSTEPAEKLFPTFQRAEALNPLVVLLIALPGVFALQYSTLNEEAASWNLISLDLIAYQDLATIEGEPNHWLELHPSWMPPLSHWISAGLFELIGSHWMSSMLYQSYLSTVGLLVVFFLMVRHLASSQLAFVTLLLLSMHGPLLTQFQTPLPISLSLVCGVGFLALGMRHYREPDRWFSWDMAGAGCVLGVAVLAGGPVVMVFPLLIIAHLGWKHLEIERTEVEAKGESWSNLREELLSLGLALLLAAFVSGWWIVLQLQQNGSGFLLPWILSDILSPVESRHATPANLIDALLFALHGLLGFSVLGFRRSFSAIRHDSRKYLTPWLSLAQVWMPLGFICWLGSALFLGSISHLSTRILYGFFVLPSVALAAYAVAEIARRKISGGPVVIAALLTAVLLNLKYLNGSHALRWFIWGGTISVLLMIIFVIWMRSPRLVRQTYSRLFLTIVVLVMIGSNIGLGLISAQKETQTDRYLQQVRRDLLRTDLVTRYTVISGRQLPADFEWFFRSLWPEVPMKVYNTWDTAISTELLPSGQEVSRHHLIIVWNIRENRPAAIPSMKVALEEVTQPTYFRNHQLRVYQLKPLPIAEPLDLGSLGELLNE